MKKHKNDKFEELNKDNRAESELLPNYRGTRHPMSETYEGSDGGGSIEYDSSYDGGIGSID